MRLAIRCPCGVEVLIEDTITRLEGPCPHCGRPLDVELHRSAALLAGVSATPQADIPPVLVAVPVLQSEENSPPSAAEAPPPVPVAAPVPREEADPLASLTEGEPAQLRGRHVRLYSPRAVAAAALLGGWPAGCLLLAANFQRLRRTGAAWSARLLGVLGTLGILWAVMKYTDVPPRLGALLYLGPVFLAELVGAALLLLAIAWLLQGRAFAAHLAAGGRREPGRGVVGTCLLSGAIFFLVQTLATYPVTWQGSGSNVVFGSDEEIYFTEGVSRDLAIRLGRKLQEFAIFDNQGAKTVVVSKRDNGFEVRLFVASWHGGPALDLGPLDWLRRTLSAEVFDGSHVRIVVCDQQGRPLRVID
jgi:hypothetical protein